MVETIYFHFTSDFHSHFENWPKLMHYVKEKTEQHRQNGDTHFLFDNGDHLDRSHPITEAFLGKANVELLNKAKYDVVTIGNNEGITLPKETFQHLYDDAHFQVVCANLFPVNQATPEWLKPYTILTTNSGVKIGVIGLTAPFNAFYNHLGWKVTSPYEVLDKVLKEVSLQSDIIVLLSHLGLSEDEQISNLYRNIDVIIGGHTHHLFKNGEIHHNTLLGAVGKFGYFIGEIQLKWDHQEKRVIGKDAFAIEVLNEENDQQNEAFIHTYDDKAKALLNKPVAFLKEDLPIDWFQENPLMQKLTDTLREWTNADCAMLNAGVLLEGLSKGPITWGDIHRICPHPINPATVVILGDQLLETIRMVQTSQFTEFELKGFGFRGKQLGKMVYSNMEVETIIGSDGVERLSSINVQGKPIEMEKEYTLATADTFTFGKLLPSLTRAQSKEYFLPEFLRDLLLSTLKKMNT